MNKDELIGKLQMVYVGDKNALNELIGYYDGLKEVVELVKEENQSLKEQYCERTDCSGRIKESKQYESLVQKVEAQQKEFIEWLEDKIEERNNDIKILGQDVYTSKFTYQEVLSKYKEIIGVKDE